MSFEKVSLPAVFHKERFIWIKSLDTGRHAWVNINHITHFEIELSNNPAIKPYDVVEYLDTETIGHSPRQGEIVEGQAFVTLKHGTHEECEQFIREQIGLQATWQ